MKEIKDVEFLEKQLLKVELMLSLIVDLRKEDNSSDSFIDSLCLLRALALRTHERASAFYYDRFLKFREFPTYFKLHQDKLREMKEEFEVHSHEFDELYFAGDIK